MYKKNIPLRYLLAFFMLLIMPYLVQGQEKMDIMKDTLDGKLDFSRFLIDVHGFIPVPMLITEPALGNFGGLIAPVFLQNKKVEGFTEYVPPDITAALGMITLNGSWAVGAARVGSFPKLGIKYRAFIGYASINLDFYRDISMKEERKFSFNIQPLPISVSVSKRLLKKYQTYLGVSYSFTPTQVAPNFNEEIPTFVNELDLDNHTAALGLFAEWDTRNTIFTPDKGLRVHVGYNLNASWTGSDYSYQQLSALVNWFVQIKQNWVSGLRTEVKQLFSDPPFYLYPSISLRGVPAARYQGATTIVLETEQRFDLSLRWSVLGFAGYGKAVQKGQGFEDGKDVYNVGTGLRYLLARAFNLRAGLDIAVGPDSFGYYIVFGHNWNR